MIRTTLFSLIFLSACGIGSKSECDKVSDKKIENGTRYECANKHAETTQRVWRGLIETCSPFSGYAKYYRTENLYSCANEAGDLIAAGDTLQDEHVFCNAAQRDKWVRLRIPKQGVESPKVEDDFFAAFFKCVPEVEHPILDEQALSGSGRQFSQKPTDAVVVGTNGYEWAKCDAGKVVVRAEGAADYSCRAQ